jgi:protease I
MPRNAVSERGDREAATQTAIRGRRPGMPTNLNGKRVAIVATDMVEEAELVEPRKALEDAGAATELISLQSGTIQGVNHHEKANTHEVDRVIEDVNAADYDAILIPGGVANPDRLRTEPPVVDFVRCFYDDGKPIASICHGPWLLVEADVVRDLTLTSWPSLQTDIRNAGGTWVDEQVTVDDGVVTSRKPDDILAFNEKMIEEFAEGIHSRKRRVAAAAR